MEACDEILIECSREQAVASNGNASWTNVLPNLILNEGDQIVCKGGWINVRNTGDNSIEVEDLLDPDSEKVDASFYLSQYKTMDAKNVVSFPYHSQKEVKECDHYLGNGFKRGMGGTTAGDPTANGTAVEDYYLVVSQATQPSPYNRAAIPTMLRASVYSTSTGAGCPSAWDTRNNCVVNRFMYETLTHPKDADSYILNKDSYDSYLEWLSNQSNYDSATDPDLDKLNTDIYTYCKTHPQGMRDSANTGNYYTLMYRDAETLRYKKLEQKVNVDIPRGYYSPENLAAFISDQLSQKTFNKVVGDTGITETWTTANRYYKGLVPVATPNSNLTIGADVCNASNSLLPNFQWAGNPNGGAPPVRTIQYPDAAPRDINFTPITLNSSPDGRQYGGGVANGAGDDDNVSGYGYTNKGNLSGLATGATINIHAKYDDPNKNFNVVNRTWNGNPLAPDYDIVCPTTPAWWEVEYSPQTQEELDDLLLIKKLTNFYSGIECPYLNESTEQVPHFYTTCFVSNATWNNEQCPNPNWAANIPSTPPAAIQQQPFFYGVIYRGSTDNPYLSSSEEQFFYDPVSVTDEHPFGTFTYSIEFYDTGSTLGDVFSQSGAPGSPSNTLLGQAASVALTIYVAPYTPTPAHAFHGNCFISCGGQIGLAADKWNVNGFSGALMPYYQINAAQQFRLPIGAPLPIGTMNQTYDIATLAEALETDPTIVNVPMNWSENVGACYTQANDTTAWLPPLFSFNSASSMNADLPINVQMPFGTGTANYLEWIQRDGANNTLDFANGNKYLGGSYGNFNRWSRLNHELPEPSTGIDDVNCEPILRKYPNFTEYGMKMGVESGDTPNQTYREGLIYPPIPDLVNTNVCLTPPNIDLTAGTGSGFGRRYVEDPEYITEVDARARADLWRDFITAQINDGMIDKSQEFVENGITYFYAYAHAMVEYSRNDDTAHSPTTIGNDEAGRDRPRGVIIQVEKNSFYDTTDNQPISFELADQTYYGGFLLTCFTDGSVKLELTLNRWIANKQSGGFHWGNGSQTPKDVNYAFWDYNLVSGEIQEGLNTGELKVYTNSYQFWNVSDTASQQLRWSSIYDLVEARADGSSIRFAIGFSPCASAWRGFTSYLTSYTCDLADTTSLLFQTGIGRKNINYRDRVYVGGRDPVLAFDTEGSGRFYWSQFYTPQQVSNEYDDGVDDSTNSTAGTLNPSITDSPIDGFSIDGVRDGWTYDSTDKTYSFAKSLNSSAGTDCIQYNTNDWRLHKEGLFQAAPDLNAHDPFMTNCWIDDPATAGDYDTCSCKIREAACYITGNQSWCGSYPLVNDDGHRFFCFDSDVRKNTHQVVTQVGNHNNQIDVASENGGAGWIATGGDGGIGYGGGEQKIDTAQVLKPCDTQLPVEDQVGNAWTPTAFWGCAPNPQGWITRTASCGTALPSDKLLYDTQCGVQVYSWGQYNATNWDKSFWSILGFDLTDMKPTPYQYCSQQRNYTTTFLTIEDPLFETKSYPMRTDGDLTTTGFVSINTSLIGALQYLTQYPQDNILSSVGIQGIQTEAQYMIYSRGGNANIQIANTAIVAPGTPQSLQYNVQDPESVYNIQMGLQALASTLDNIQLPRMEYSNGGASLANGEIVKNNFFISAVSDLSLGTKIYASNTATKIDQPFFLIRSNLPEDNFKYSNNQNLTNGSISQSVAIIQKQYGATSDFFWSLDVSELTFTNRRHRVVNEISIEITDNFGRLATTIEDKSTIFFKIVRAPISTDPNFPVNPDIGLTDDIDRIEMNLDNAQRKNLNDQVDDLLGAGINFIA